MRTRVYFSGDCEKVVFWWFRKNQGYHRFLHFLLILGENPNHQAKNVRFLVITRKFVITRFQITRKNPGSHEITRSLLVIHYLVVTRVLESADVRQTWWFEPGDYIIWWFEPGDYIIWWFGPGDYIIWWSETWWLHYLVIWAWWLHYLVIWRLVITRIVISNHQEWNHHTLKVITTTNLITTSLITRYSSHQVQIAR